MIHEHISSILVAFLIAAATLTAAAEQPPPKGKDLCLLHDENCPDRKDDIVELIAKLKREIARGTEVYTPAELKKLQNKLEEYERLLDVLLYHNTN
ncbi:hypothetical protein [Geobacter sp.]|uniref:hypothetical protein n=1 Tax=Geobacter sp. TaxID=46610 RepID=UPI002616E33F|nr:hypothetical protein [Geobacter sp.]